MATEQAATLHARQTNSVEGNLMSTRWQRPAYSPAEAVLS